MSEYGGSGSAAPPSPGPAGWYADPWAQAEQRWFDGTQWTPTTAPSTQPGEQGGAQWGPPGAAAAGGWGSGPPVPSKKSRVGLIIACVVAGLVVVLAALGTVGYLAFKDEASFAQAGDCIDMTGVGTPAVNARKVGCDAPNAINKVAVRIDRANATCPNENYDFYYEDTIGDFTLCMTLNARQGECFLGNETNTTRVACQRQPESAGFVFRIDQILEGVNRPSQCKATNRLSEGIGYPTPPQTICIVALEPL